MAELTVQSHGDRIGQLAELRDFIKASPVSFRRELKAGPREEPTCGLCSAIAAAGGCSSYADDLQDYHDVGVVTLAELADVELGEFAEALDQMGDLGERVLRAVAGALSAERCLTLYLLAGWTPPRVRRALMGGGDGRA